MIIIMVCFLVLIFICTMDKENIMIYDLINKTTYKNIEIKNYRSLLD